MKKICQIILTNIAKGWTKKEIFGFVSILILIAAILVINICKNRIRKEQAIAILLLAIYIGIVFGSTVFTRSPSIRRYRLIPLWSWGEIIYGNRGKELLIENFLNVMLLLPMGILLPCAFDRKIKKRRVFLYGLLVSVVIEGCQLIFKCGLFEWDDMIHNGFGCMLGGTIGNLIMGKKNRRK